MIRLTTESGATYHVDIERGRVTRTGPHSPGIDYSTLPDDQWHTVLAHDPFEVGKSAAFRLGASRYRITTPVTHIEEVDL